MDRRLVYSLQKLPDDRSHQDLEIIATYLHSIEGLNHLRDSALKRLSKVVYYEYHDGNTPLWKEGDLCTCWYILLTGSVLIEPRMYLPRSSFGKPNSVNGRRINDSTILEPSEMVVIPNDGGHHHAHSGASGAVLRPASLANQENAYKRNSRASDTNSSIYSTEDGPINDSSILDSDDEESYGNESVVTDVDQARECLEKNPEERNEDDIEILLEFLQNLPAFANMTMAIRRALCAVMVYAVVSDAGTVVMNDGEELDSWSVILNGRVKISYAEGSSNELSMGDSFGIKATKEKEFHQGVMITMEPDCQFVCIAQDNYYEILSAGEENTTKYEENGKVVLVTEKRSIDNGERDGNLVINGTPERLIKHLIEDRSTVDMTYDEDFLLTYRLFLTSPMMITSQLLDWFDDDKLRERITRVVLLWVNNHFNDFESDMEMTEFLQQFEDALEDKSMHAHLKFLHIACAAKARPRSVTLTRATRDEILHFSILGGIDQDCGIFISNVERGSKAYDGGLKRGDQILEVNGTNFEGISHSKALDVLRGTTLLSITVKSNLLAFKEMLCKSNRDTSQGAYAVKTAKHLIKITKRHDADSDSLDGHQPVLKKSQKTGTGKTKLMKMFAKMTLLTQPKVAKLTTHDSFDKGDSGRGRSNSLTDEGSTLTRSNSSPDVSQGFGVDDTKAEMPGHVLKIYRADQSCKYFLVHKETTTRDVVNLALRQFGISEHSLELQDISCSNYSLCEVSVEHGGLVKQKRLPDQASNLGERIGVRSRYYLRNNMSQETLVPDEAAQELLKETHFTFLSLNPMELAMQLTINDYKVFQDIEPTEYTDNLIGRDSKYGTASLLKFEKLVNREMFWVPSVVCSESNVYRRMKCIKLFIKIAKYCKEFKNFNSMFAILSGLNTGTVSRLHNTWEKLPNKYQKIFDDLMTFLNPTRNMARYRGLLSQASSLPPVIPIFPIVKKDLAFIELGNDTFVNGLVNFEKMRMVAKEVRHIVGLASAQYQPAMMTGSIGTVTTASGLFNMSAVSGFATTRRKKRGSTLYNHPKKMFEEAQMCRRVRAYLGSLIVVEDEDKLNDMSMGCEGKARSEIGMNSANPSSPQLAGSKLGASNPYAANKLMSLSEKSRPVNHKHLEKMTSPTPVHKSFTPFSAPSNPSGGRPKPVDLTTESSSVLGSMRSGGVLRKLSTTSTVSRSSTGSQPSSGTDKYVNTTAPSACEQLGSVLSEENDSGHHSMYETHSMSSAASSQQPSPPSNVSTVTSISSNGQPTIHSRIRVTGTGTAAAAGANRPLPDYQAAAQMAYLSRQHSVNPDYYHAVMGPDCDDEDIEEVVSAV